MSVARKHPAAFGMAVLVLGALLAPLIIVVGVSLNEGPQQHFPPQGLSLHWYAVAASRSEFHSALLLSLGLAALATLVSLLVGTLAALALTRYTLPGRQQIQLMLMSPLLVPQVVFGMAFMVTLTQMGLVGSMTGLAALHVVLTLPFTTRVMTSALLKAELSRELAARSLGAHPVRAFAVVTLPLIRPGLATAATFAFVTSFDNFTATQFLIWRQTTLPVEIYHYIRTESDPTVAAVSSLLMFTIAAIVVLMNRFVGLDMVTGRRDAGA